MTQLKATCGPSKPKTSAAYLASEHQRQRVVRAGNFAMAQQWSALRALHYRRHSWVQHKLSDRLRRRKRKRQAAMQDNPSRLSSQRKGQHHTRERLCTTCTIPSPPLGSLSNITRIYIAPCPHPQQGQLPLLCFLWLPYLLMEEKWKIKHVSLSSSLYRTWQLWVRCCCWVLMVQYHKSSISSRTKSHHIWTVEYNQISFLDFRHVVSAQWDKSIPISSQRWERKVPEKQLKQKKAGKYQVNTCLFGNYYD